MNGGTSCLARSGVTSANLVRKEERIFAGCSPDVPPFMGDGIGRFQCPALLSTAALRLKSGRVIARSEYKWTLVFGCQLMDMQRSRYPSVPCFIGYPLMRCSMVEIAQTYLMYL